MKRKEKLPLDILARMEELQFEQVELCHDPASGLKAIIAIHNTQLGPALGGCRMWPYASGEDALNDALRLARGMTYKAAVSGLPYGGGKAVIVGNPETDKSDALFRSLGRFIRRLHGRYITGIDMGTTVQDMDSIRLETEYVTDTSHSGVTGEYTSEMTAYGVYLGIRAAVRRVYGSGDLTGRTVAVQGVGKVGFALCRYLHDDGALIVASDIDPAQTGKAASLFGAKTVPPEQIYAEACDIFAPCAFGGILNDSTLPQLRTAIVAGGANNQLAEAAIGDRLQQSGIVYVPDYVLNAGGLIITAAEQAGRDAAFAKHSVENIYDTVTRVFELAAKERISTAAAADRLAEQLLRSQ